MFAGIRIKKPVRWLCVLFYRAWHACNRLSVKQWRGHKVLTRSSTCLCHYYTWRNDPHHAITTCSSPGRKRMFLNWHRAICNRTDTDQDLAIRLFSRDGLLKHILSTHQNCVEHTPFMSRTRQQWRGTTLVQVRLIYQRVARWPHGYRRLINTIITCQGTRRYTGRILSMEFLKQLLFWWQLKYKERKRRWPWWRLNARH